MDLWMIFNPAMLPVKKIGGKNMSKYYVSAWALLRKAEVMDLSEDFEVHSDYLKILSKEKIVSILQNIKQMFLSIYQDIADHPEQFKMPLVEIIEEERTKMGAPPAKALSSKTAPYMFFNALINVLNCGNIENGELIVDDHEKLKAENKEYQVKNVDAQYSQFGNYGLHLDGLKNFKFTKDTGKIILSYPDDPEMLAVLKWMADKADRHGRRHDFMLCQYRFLQDNMDSLNYGYGADFIADRLHTEAEQDCVYKLDEALRKAGLAPYIDTTDDNNAFFYSLLYYENEKDKGKLDKSNIRISSILSPELKGMKLPCVSQTQASLYLRIRTKNIQNGVEHIKKCSDELKSIFLKDDKGCGNRESCEVKKHAFGGGQAYTIDGVKYWKCGCHTGNFITLHPRSEDIADYVELVNLFNQA